MKIKTLDLVASYGVTRREYTDEGFLKVPGRVARTGIQQYLAKELGITDRNPLDVINVYRPPEEVFSAESLASYDAKDVTDDHPSEMVSADTYKKLTVGHVRGLGVQDGDFVFADLIVKDAEAIKKIETGKVQLSAGYTAEYVHSPGVTDDGQEYEFIQRDIRINHVALVDKARAGAMARVFDKSPTGDKPMPRVTLDNGRAIEVQSEAEAALVQDALQQLKDKATNAEAKANKAQKTIDSMQAKLDAKDAELDKSKKASSDEAISKRLKELETVKGRACKVAGKEFSCDSLDPMAIKRAALESLKMNLDGKSEAYIEAAFDMAEEKAEEAEDEDEEDKKKSTDSLSRLAASLSSPVADGEKKSAKDRYTQELENAWKTNHEGA
jgi:uncharacterized protein